MFFSARTVKIIKAVKKATKDKELSRKAKKELMKYIRKLRKSCLDYIIISENALDFAGSQRVVDKLRKKGYTVEPIKNLADYGIVISYLSYDELPEDIKRRIEKCRGDN